MSVKNYPLNLLLEINLIIKNWEKNFFYASNPKAIRSCLICPAINDSLAIVILPKKAPNVIIMKILADFLSRFIVGAFSFPVNTVNVKNTSISRVATPITILLNVANGVLAINGKDAAVLT